MGGRTQRHRWTRSWVVMGIVMATLLAGSWVVYSVVDRDGGQSAVIPVLDALQIGGVVFSDLDDDGVLDPGEPGIPGLEISVRSRLAGNDKRLVSTADGSFSHPTGAVRTGVVRVRVPTPPPDGGDEPVEVVVEREARQGEPVVIPIHGRAITCPDPRDCPDLLLPDLTSLGDNPPSLDDEQRREYPSPSEWFLDAESEPGRVLLRVATVSSNDGTGPVVVVGVDREDEKYTRTVQRIFTPRLGYVDVPAEPFHFHESHEHVHVDAYQELVLRDGSGRVASHSKISFCLTDVFPAGARPPEWRPVAVDVQLFDCGVSLQGINTGMTDYYGPLLPDQYVDVTDVPPGHYTLDIVVDPRDLIVESDETNNLVSLEVTITG